MSIASATRVRCLKSSNESHQSGDQPGSMSDPLPVVWGTVSQPSGGLSFDAQLRDHPPGETGGIGAPTGPDPRHGAIVWPT